LRWPGRHLGLSGTVGIACLLAAHAAAAPPPTLFRLSIVGTAHETWTFTAAPMQDGACTRTEKSEGIRSATFRTKSSALVRLSGGRILPVTIAKISGTVTLAGANTTDKKCGGAGSSKIADCVTTKRSFTGARVRVASPRRGVLSFGAVTNVRLAASICPFEPTEVKRRPLGPSAGLIRLPKQALMERRVTRITLHASRSRRKAYTSPQAGSLIETGEWKFLFVRARG
jgi:hypothetical protein